MIEVPDEEDDMAFKQWLANGSPIVSPKKRHMELPTPPETPPKGIRLLPNEGVAPNDITQTEVISPMVAKSLATGVKAVEVPHRWMKPFEANWMLQAVLKARSSNAAHAALCVWMHKD